MAAPAKASPPTMRAESWAQLTQLLYEDSWAESLGLYRSRFVFRGEPSTEEPLRTSLQRLGPSAADVEHHLLRNFRKFASPSSAPGRSWWDWLAVAQHHGLPTRLLDWTFSPYVALHFATDPVAADGAVWCVDFRLLHEDLPKPLTRLLARERADLFTTEMLSSAAERLEELPGGRRRPYAVFFDPPSMDARLTNQFSVFSFLSDPGAEMLSVLRRRPGSARRIVIPRSLKSEVRDKLDQANITERVLFPGLDGLARWLSRYYAPRIRAGGSAPPQEEAPDVDASSTNRARSLKDRGPWPGGEPSRKRPRPMPQKGCHDHGPHSVDPSDRPRPRGHSGMAVQPKLGLRAERRARARRPDSPRPRSHGKTLTNS